MMASPIEKRGAALPLLLALCAAIGACATDVVTPETPAASEPEAGAPASPDAGGGGLPGADAAAPRDAEADGAPAPKSLRIMSFNIKHGDIGGLEGVADVIKTEAADLVGLQEVDVGAVRSGKVDQAHRLGQLTGMTSLFRTSFDFADGGSYGVALLSRFPVISSERVLLTSSGEQRILAVVDVELAKGRLVSVGITHMDLQAASRATQAQQIVTKLGQKPLAVVMGDFNAQPTEASIGIFTGAFVDGWAAAGTGPGYTIPPSAPTRRIDYVMLAKGWPKPTSAKVVMTAVSDHLPVVLDVPLPP